MNNRISPKMVNQIAVDTNNSMLINKPFFAIKLTIHDVGIGKREFLELDESLI